MGTPAHQLFLDVMAPLTKAAHRLSGDAPTFTRKERAALANHVVQVTKLFEASSGKRKCRGSDTQTAMAEAAAAAKEVAEAELKRLNTEAEAEANEMGLHHLPDPGIQQHVLGYLSPKDLGPVMCTSKAFSALTRPFRSMYRHWNLRAAEAQHAPKP